MDPITVNVINPSVKKSHKLKLLSWEGKLKKKDPLQDILLEFMEVLIGRLRKGTETLGYWASFLLSRPPCLSEDCTLDPITR